ncbi:tyrosyl-DNA phosphodiesterase 1-like [Watersipora subatra]|uniref:tyrosyl-DNA phosphodiesterase 1-like n=1 Tax=Watersipora subatra TaxID=2589382 RepID=UPI00355C4DB9
MGDKSRNPCPYGENCTRKNPKHFMECTHPQTQTTGESSSKRGFPSSSSDSGTVEKKVKYAPSTSEIMHDAATVSTKSHKNKEMSPAHQVALAEKCTKYRYYMSRVHHSIDSSFNEGSSLTLHNVINGTQGNLIDSCWFSYMYDLNWIRQQFKPEDRNKPMTVVEGLQGSSRIELLEQRNNYTNIKVIQAQFSIPYGVHHTKMAILRYDKGIRIMITTANLIPLDWFHKSQALWCSPLCPLGNADSETNFKADLIEYLEAYKSPILRDWASTLSKYDMSKCKVFLIASVPGRHKQEKKFSFGHLKLRKVLEQHGPKASAATWPVIGQFSSIGRLGADPSNWLTGEFLISLSTTLKSNARNKPALRLIYPTVEDVRTSLEGYQAGGSLPFSQLQYNGQPYIRSLMHKWKSECRGRTRAAPHIKSYLRLSPNNAIPWFLMTSSNLSKAAWGMAEKEDSQLMIRSYELGVLFLPKMFDTDSFVYDPTFADPKAFPVPFDLPPTQYSSDDEIWIVDKSYRDKKDSVGDYWH